MGTKIWGPLGWMTLHSISAIYPEQPSQSDRLVLEEFMNAFRETITCPHCKRHFSSLYATYTRLHPDWSSSRQSLFVFICRAHNTVNRRLDKPIQKTVSECLTALINATSTKSQSEYRKAYLDYLGQTWKKQTGAEGLMMMGFVRKLIKINTEYFTLREIAYSDIIIQEDTVAEFIPENTAQYKANQAVLDPIHYRGIQVGFKNGRFIKR